MIVFAENFAQDIPETIMQRYPGSTRNLGTATVENPTAWPLTNTSYFVADFPLFREENNRFEMHLCLSPTTGSFNNNVGNPYSVFGIEFRASATETWIMGCLVPDLLGVEEINLILERRVGRFMLIVVADDQVILTPTLVDWSPTNWIGYSASSPSGTWFRALPGWLEQVVVAYDTDPKTRLSNIEFTKHGLTVGNTGTWTYTDQGYVQDTDKADPSTEEPSIGTEDFSEIEFEVEDPADYTQIYVNVRSERAGEALAVQGRRNAARPTQRVVPVHRLEGTAVRMATVEQPGQQNDDNVIFLGERDDFISYADLSTALSFTDGTVNTADGGNKWLEFIIDGKHCLVSKVSARYGLSWSQIYAAGLVYGTDDFGLFPAGTPVNQLRTVEIGGSSYLVRLLKGADTDPYFGTFNASDPVGTYNSEWTRLFAPISVTVFPSYTGPKLADYSNTELGVVSSAAGRSSWCQELSSTSRLWRGGTSPSYLGLSLPAGATAASGWRPLLVQVS